MTVEVLAPSDAVQSTRGTAPDQLSRVLDAENPHAPEDALRALSAGVAARTLDGVTGAVDVLPLRDYKDDAAGGMMTAEFIALRDTMTVWQAMEFIRRSAAGLDPEDVSYILVVDGRGALKGGISLSQLVLAIPYQRVSLLMYPEIISIPADTDREQCVRLMERYNLRTLPVLDDSGGLVGILRLEDMVDVIEDEATEDMYRMIGVNEEEKALGPFWRSVLNRLPWLCVNLGTAILAGLVITLFQSTMARAIALAAFLPVIAGQGGIAGTQTLTLMVRSLALGEISSANTRRLLLKEAGLGLVHGLALGVLVGAVVWIWKGNEYLALVVALAMLSSLVVAGVSGVLVPLGLKTLRIDPALASAVAVTTVTEVFGFLVYLGLATLAIGLIADKPW